MPTVIPGVFGRPTIEVNTALGALEVSLSGASPYAGGLLGLLGSSVGVWAVDRAPQGPPLGPIDPLKTCHSKVTGFCPPQKALRGPLGFPKGTPNTPRGPQNRELRWGMFWLTAKPFLKLQDDNPEERKITQRFKAIR